MYTTCAVDGLNPWRDRYNPCTVQLPLRLEWMKGLYKGGADVPLVSEHHNYVLSNKPYKNSIAEEKLSVFSRDKGKVVWERSFQNIDISNAYCLSGDTVFFSTKKELLALRDDQVQWEVAGYFDSPVVVDEFLVLSGMDGVSIVDPETGELLRKIELNCPVGVSCREGILVVGTTDNQLHGFELATGKRLWQTDLTRQCQWVHPATKEMTHGQVYRWAPVIADQKIVLQTKFNTCCLDLQSGALLWERAYEHSPLITGWACGNQRLFCFNQKSLICVDLASGEPVFVRQIRERPTWGAAPPFLTENVLFIASEGLHAFSTETGDMLWEFWPKLRGRQNFTAMPVFVEGRLYASGKDGFLYCFGQEN